MPALHRNKVDWLLKSVWRRIEQQVLGLSGIGLGAINFMQSANDPGLYGSELIISQVHSNFTSLLCSGINALLLQMLHPSALV